jgi:chemotaxis protein MotA
MKNMEITTIIGLVLAVIVIIGSFLSQHISLLMLLSEEAAIVIILGTITAVFMAHPWSDVKVVPKLFKVLFSKDAGPDKIEVINIFKELAEKVRRSGIISIDQKVNELSDPFMQRGMRLVVDNQSSEAFIRGLMEDEIGSMQERHQTYAKIFTSAGAYAPVLGVLGAAIGLINAMSQMGSPEKLSEAIAAAFICTIFGIFTGYILWTPSANKLKVKSQKEVQLRYMMIEGVIALQERNGPRVVEERLTSFLSPQERVRLVASEADAEDKIEEIQQVEKAEQMQQYGGD